MTVQQQPPQEQQGQGRSLSIRRKMATGNVAEQVQAVNGVNGANGQRPVDYLPTVTLPAPGNTPSLGAGQNATPAGRPAGGNGANQPLNQMPVPPTPRLPESASFPARAQVPPTPTAPASAMPTMPAMPPTPDRVRVMTPAQVPPAPPPRPPSTPVMPVQPSHPSGGRVPQQPEIVGNSVILHRSPNFVVRTIYRPGQRPKPLRRPSGHTARIPKVMPQQEQRIAVSETKVMPAVAPINPVKIKKFPVPSWLEATVIIVGLLVSAVAHALNMFNFPRYELDEGTYISNAWAILHGQLSPYAYGYGHPPLAWIQIAAWLGATGSLFSFGDAINSGRVLMLLYSLGCALLVYLIIRRLDGSRSAALLAMVIFSLSPISLTYQRQVLLDN